MVEHRALTNLLPFTGSAASDLIPLFVCYLHFKIERSHAIRGRTGLQGFPVSSALAMPFLGRCRMWPIQFRHPVWSEYFMYLTETATGESL